MRLRLPFRLRLPLRLRLRLRIRRPFWMLLSPLPVLLSCAPTKLAPATIAPPPGAGAPAASVVAVAPVTGEPIAVTNTNNASIATSDESGDGERDGGDGWVRKDDALGVEVVARDEALAKIAKSPVRVLVRARESFQECSGAGGTHVIFDVPDSWGAKPFHAAVLGGHTVYLQGVFPPGHLYVAGVHVGKLGEWHKGSGWCLDDMGPTDAGVDAIVPVRSEAEGLRLLGKMR